MNVRAVEPATKPAHSGIGDAVRGLTRREEFRRGVFIFPAVIFLLVFFAYPLVRLLAGSFFTPEFTLEHYLRVFSEPVYRRVLWNTFSIAFTVSVVCVVLGYPVAALLSSVSKKIGARLMFLVLLPFWTSVLIRTYAWMILLQREGLVNTWLMEWGMIGEPMQMVFNRLGVVIAMVHVLLPFMIFPLYSVMAGIDRTLMRASENLGANPLQGFLRVFLPLSAPGVMAGFLLVFIQSLGFYITPALIGGRGDVIMAMVIDNQVRSLLNWEFGSALALMLLVSTLILFAIGVRYFGLARIWGGAR